MAKRDPAHPLPLSVRRPRRPGLATWAIPATLAGALALSIACGDSRSPTGLAPPMTRSDCLAKAVFGAPGQSAYCAPFAAGTTTYLHQSYCSSPGRSHETRFALDFSCAHGDEVLAARGGVVESLDERWPDDETRAGNENQILVRHPDGTVGFYAHFQPQSIPVEVGDTVVRGQLIGLCGSSGEVSGTPHLHFEVFESQHYDFDHGVPVNFRNLEGPLDSRNGLIVGETYTVLPCD